MRLGRSGLGVVAAGPVGLRSCIRPRLPQLSIERCANSRSRVAEYCGLKDGSPVVFDDLEPSGEMSGVVFLDLRRDRQISAWGRHGEPSDQFVREYVAPQLPTKIATRARGVLGATGTFAGRRSNFLCHGGIDGCHLDVVTFLRGMRSGSTRRRQTRPASLKDRQET